MTTNRTMTCSQSCSVLHCYDQCIFITLSSSFYLIKHHVINLLQLNINMIIYIFILYSCILLDMDIQWTSWHKNHSAMHSAFCRLWLVTQLSKFSSLFLAEWYHSSYSTIYYMFTCLHFCLQGFIFKSYAQSLSLCRLCGHAAFSFLFSVVTWCGCSAWLLLSSRFWCQWASVLLFVFWVLSNMLALLLPVVLFTGQQKTFHHEMQLHCPFLLSVAYWTIYRAK